MMNMPRNTFKERLRLSQAMIGLWIGLADGYSAEVCAGAGFDWLLLDGEHAPNDIRTLLAQMQAVEQYTCHPVIRPVNGDPALIKQLLDIGAQTLLVPMVDSAEQAAELVRATRYPPQGFRGVGSALARASRFNRIPGYLHKANDEICLLVQIESAAAVDNAAAIAAVEGVDGVFIGPADLSASLGHIGNPTHPDVQRVIEQLIGTITRAGKAAGILMADGTLARRYIELGARFVAVGTDVTVLARGTEALAKQFRTNLQPGAEPAQKSVY
jgi:4-hydroxy-2-oxoheptanedioate aldolase